MEAEVAIGGVDEEGVLGEAVFVDAFFLFLAEEGLAEGGVAGAEVDVVIGVGVFGEGSDGDAEVFGLLIEDDFVSGVVEDVALVGAAGEGAFVEFEEHGGSLFAFVGAGTDVGDDVVDAAVVEFDLHSLGPAAVDEVFGDEGVALAAVGADGGLHDGGGEEVVNVISADDVSGSAAANVDAIAIVELLHGVVDFVKFDEVVVGVEVGADVIDGESFSREVDFASADGADEFAAVTSP